jgi:hypothetical protein
MAFLGVIYPVLTATTVVETVTETVAQPGRTVTTVTVLEGGDVVIRVESPGAKVIVYYERQQQVCTVRFTAMTLPRQPGVIAFPGTTVTVPGATATLVLSAPTEITATKPLSTAFTTTGYTALNITRTLTIGTFATAVTMPTEFVTRDPALENLKTTVTVTKGGETNTATIYIGPTTITLRTRAEGSTVTTTVVMPGTTYVRTYLVTRTLAEPMTLGAFAAVAVAVVIGILLGYRRGRY